MSFCNLTFSSADLSIAIAERAKMPPNLRFEKPRFWSGVLFGSVISSWASESNCSYRLLKSRLVSSSAVFRLSPMTSFGRVPNSSLGIGLSLERYLDSGGFINFQGRTI